MGLTESARELFSKVEVLRDLEQRVKELMDTHLAKRVLWMPDDLLGPAPDADPDAHTIELRKRAQGIPDFARAAIAVNLLTEEGLPHFHRLLAVYLGDDSFWRLWNNMWTAEEDRHGQVLHDYAREARIFDQKKMEQMQYAYLERGFHPAWDKDPYRVFVYTTVQERATQHTHAQLGEVVEEYEPRLARVLRHCAMDEARHFVFYREVFKEILARDPNQGLVSASLILPGIEMPGHSMPAFRDLADVIRRAGVYGPRDYLRIAEEAIRYWKVEALTGLDEIGRAAQEKILQIPARLRRVAEIIETRSVAKTFSFEVVWNREFAMP